MQICFRCDNTTNTLLDNHAYVYGISKNQLINSIVQEYLGQNPNHSKAPSIVKDRQKLVAELRQTNEILTQILTETNDFYFRFHDEHTSQESSESLRLFRTELIGCLTDISVRLDKIRKDMIP